MEKSFNNKPFEQPESDISDLYSNLGLDASSYRNFNHNQPVKNNRIEAFDSPDESNEFEQSPSPEDRRTEEFIPPSQSSSENFLRPAQKATEAKSAAESNKTRARENAFTQAKHRLHSKATVEPHKTQASSHYGKSTQGQFQLLDRIARGGTRRSNVDAPIIGLLSSSGGVGKTTLAVSLSVALAEQLGQCAVIGSNNSLLLPCYLGGLSMPAGDLTVYKDLSIARNGSLDLALGNISLIEMLRYPPEQFGSANCIIVDVDTAPDALDLLPYLDRALIVLRPDIGALLGIEQIDSICDSLSPRRKPDLGYIVNQFDSSLDVHCQVRQAIDEHTQGRLFAPELPSDAEVQAALANGQVPQIMRRGSDFSRGIKRIASTLKSEINERHSLMGS